METEWGGEHGADAMAELLSRPQVPTAVFAHSDEVAAGALRTIRRAGLRVPEDVSVVGIDDHPIAALLELTTVAQSVVRQGELTARMLLQILRDDPGHVDRQVTVPTRLVVRRTTAAPRDRI